MTMTSAAHSATRTSGGETDDCSRESRDDNAARGLRPGSGMDLPSIRE